MALTQDQINNARSRLDNKKYETTMKFGLMGKPPKKVKPSDDQPGMLSSIADWAVNYFSKDEVKPPPQASVSIWDNMPPIVNLITENFMSRPISQNNTYNKAVPSALGAIPSGQDLTPQLMSDPAKPNYASEAGDLVGRLDGQRGYVGTDTSAAVADALIGNSVVAPVAASDAAPSVSKSIGIMSKPSSAEQEIIIPKEQSSKPVTNASLMQRPSEDPAPTIMMTGDAEQDLLDRIAFGEGARPDLLAKQGKLGIGSTPYDMVLGYGIYAKPSKPITDMTMSEVFEYQKELINATKGKLSSGASSAVGKYQFISTYLYGPGGTADKPKSNSWMTQAGLTATDKFTPEVQEVLGRLVLKEAGYNRFLNSNRTKADGRKFQNNLAAKWASVAKAGKKEGAYKDQTVHTFDKDLKWLFDNFPKQGGELKSAPRPKPRPESIK
jgi:hypothetical protein